MSFQDHFLVNAMWASEGWRQMGLAMMSTNARKFLLYAVMETVKICLGPTFASVIRDSGWLTALARISMNASRPKRPKTHVEIMAAASIWWVHSSANVS